MTDTTPITLEFDYDDWGHPRSVVALESPELAASAILEQARDLLVEKKLAYLNDEDDNAEEITGWIQSSWITTREAPHERLVGKMVSVQQACSVGAMLLAKHTGMVHEIADGDDSVWEQYLDRDPQFARAIHHLAAAIRELFPVWHHWWTTRMFESGGGYYRPNHLPKVAEEDLDEMRMVWVSDAAADMRAKSVELALIDTITYWNDQREERQVEPFFHDGIPLRVIPARTLSEVEMAFEHAIKAAIREEEVA